MWAFKKRRGCYVGPRGKFELLHHAPEALLSLHQTRHPAGAQKLDEQFGFLRIVQVFAIANFNQWVFIQ